MAERKIEAVFALKDRFTQPLNNLTRKIEASNRTIRRMGNDITRSSKMMANFGASLTKKVSAPIVGIGVASAKAASDFEKHFAKLSTIADTSKKTGVPINALKRQLRGLSEETGQSQSDLAEATYSAISAGRSTKEAVAFVKQAGVLAKGGFTDMNTSVDTLTTIMNSYGKSAGTAEEISNRLVTTQNLGKTTVAELGQSIGSVVPTANMYGVSLDNLASAYVTTTKNGIQTAQSTTAINATISELGKSGTKAAAILQKSTGKSFKDLMKSGMSLTDVLSIVDKEAKKNGKSIGDVFSNKNAIKGASTLVSHAKDFSNAMNAMGKSSGTAKGAADKMTSTTVNQLKKLKTSAQNIMIDLGNTILPMVTPIFAKISTKVKNFSTWFNSLSSGTKKTIVKVAGAIALIGPAFLVFGKIGGAVGGAIKTVGVFGRAMSKAGGFVALITSPAGIAVAAITALSVAAVLVITHWKQVKKTAGNVWNFVKSSFAKVGLSSKQMSKTFKPAIRAFGSLKRSAGQLFTAVRPIFSGIAKLAAGVFVTGFRATFRIAAGVVSGLLTAVAPIVTGILKVFTGITTFLTGVFTGNWKKAWQGIKGIFSGIAATFVGIIKAPINGMIGIINGFVGAVNGISFDIPKGFPFMGGKHIGFNIPKLKYLAKGTNNWEGGPVAINEKGGEIVDLPPGTRVYPHDKSIQKAREDGAAQSNKTVHKYDQRNITITISKVADNVTVSGDGDIDSLANKLADALRDQLLNMA